MNDERPILTPCEMEYDEQRKLHVCKNCPRVCPIKPTFATCGKYVPGRAIQTRINMPKREVRQLANEAKQDHGWLAKIKNLFKNSPTTEPEKKPCGRCTKTKQIKERLEKLREQRTDRSNPTYGHGKHRK